MMGGEFTDHIPEDTITMAGVGVFQDGNAIISSSTRHIASSQGMKIGRMQP